MEPTDRPLTDVADGETVIVSRIDAGQMMAGRLAALGVLPRMEITVVNNGHPGPCVVRVRDSRVVLGRGMADKIRVSEAGEDAGEKK